MPEIVAIYAAIAVRLLPVFVCVAVGAEWARRKLPYPAPAISLLVTSVAAPALVFHTLATTRLSNALLLQIGAAAVLGLIAMSLLSMLCLRLLGLPVRALVPTCVFPNTGNLGLPLSQLAFGDNGLAVAVAFLAVCSFIQHTLGVRMLSGRTGSAAEWKSPVMLATLSVASMRAAGIELPGPVLNSASLLGSLAMPLMLLSLGHTVMTMPSSSLGKGSCVGMVRLGVGVAAGTAVVVLLCLPGGIAGPTLLQMMMPAAVTSYMYAQRHTSHADISAAAVASSTVGFFAACPLVLWYAGMY